MVVDALGAALVTVIVKMPIAQTPRLLWLVVGLFNAVMLMRIHYITCKIEETFFAKGLTECPQHYEEMTP